MHYNVLGAKFGHQSLLDEHGDVRGAIPSIEAEVIDQDPDNDENDDSDYSPTHRKAHSETRSGGRPRAQSLR